MSGTPIVGGCERKKQACHSKEKYEKVLYFQQNHDTNNHNHVEARLVPEGNDEEEAQQHQQHVAEAEEVTQQYIQQRNKKLKQKRHQDILKIGLVGLMVLILVIVISL